MNLPVPAIAPVGTLPGTAAGAKANRLWPLRIFLSVVGGKVVMAATGFVLAGFLVLHLVGNLQVFLGPEALNEYAAMLQDSGGVKWGFRGVMLGALLLHVISGVRVWWCNREARPLDYAVKRHKKATIFSRTMIFTGVGAAAFLLYHLLHFTTGSVNAESFHFIDAQGRHDVYAMVIGSFQRTGIALTYMIGVLCIAPHVSHGVSSMFQTLGLSSKRYRLCVDWVGPIFATVITLGNLSMPLAVQFGCISMP